MPHYTRSALWGGGTIFLATGIVALICVAQIRKDDDCDRVRGTQLITRLEIMAWLTILAATVLTCAALLRIPEHWRAMGKRQRSDVQIQIE